MKREIFIKTKKNGYDTEQCGRTMTVGQLIDLLENYWEDTPIYLRHDGLIATYGSIIETDIIGYFEEDEDPEYYEED